MKTRIVSCGSGPEIRAAVLLAARALREGMPVALPTETVYGLAADALNPLACARIFEAKGRPLSDPLIVHVPDVAWLDRIAHANELAMRLVGAFWPGPLTLVLPRRDIVPDLVTAGQGTVAVRQSAHPVFHEVLAEFGGPLAAPSANRFARISPTTAQHVLSELGGRVEWILDGGPCAHGIESTIVQVTDAGVRILRRGPVTESDLAAHAEVLRGGEEGVAAPGGLASHYAPATPLEIADHAQPAPGVGLLAWREAPRDFEAVEVLSKTGDLREAAANLYAAMRRLDERGLDRILAQPVPEVGIGAAIMERLRKAAARE